MAGKLIVHDKRLEGKTPRTAPYYTCDGKTLLIYCIQFVKAYAKKRGQLDELQVMCHGYESSDDTVHQRSLLHSRGGYGLELCKEGLDLTNVHKTADWKGLIKRITLYACAPADTAAGYEGRDGDGQRFCGEMALWTGAEVIASSETQYYNDNKVIDFGAWEGAVFLFDPYSGQPTPYFP